MRAWAISLSASVLALFCLSAGLAYAFFDVRFSLSASRARVDSLERDVRDLRVILGRTAVGLPEDRISQIVTELRPTIYSRRVGSSWVVGPASFRIENGRVAEVAGRIRDPDHDHNDLISNDGQLWIILISIVLVPALLLGAISYWLWSRFLWRAHGRLVRLLTGGAHATTREIQSTLQRDRNGAMVLIMLGTFAGAGIGAVAGPTAVYLVALFIREAFG